MTTKKAAPVKQTVTARVKPEHPFGEPGKKLQTIGAYFASHAGKDLSLKEVAEACGTTTALVSVFIQRHEADFKRTPVTKTSSRWAYTAKPVRRVSKKARP